jgi:phosphatidylserine decarboxylase
VEYHPGKFLPAYRKEAGELNEWTEVWFDRAGGPVVVRQIVGILARRIVCRLKGGEQVTAGQRFGVMKFGSRIDMFIPTTATIQVKVGAGSWRDKPPAHRPSVPRPRRKSGEGSRYSRAPGTSRRASPTADSR